MESYKNCPIAVIVSKGCTTTIIYVQATFMISFLK